MNPGWRSLLFVSADDQVRLAKVARCGADAVVLDLEDAVPPARKAEVRVGLPDTISELATRGCTLVVRINAGWLDAIADLAVAVRSEVAAIMVPKVEDSTRPAVIAEIIAEITRDLEMPRPPGLVPLVESPAGMVELNAIAAVPGVIGLALGTEDFSLALGAPPSHEALELPCRLLALAAARYGRMALGLPVSIGTIEDRDAWQEGVRAGRSMGLTGALCIHPRQVGLANDGFAPTAAEVEAARRILEIWKTAGSAGVIQQDGKMIDRPVALAAERVIGRVATEKKRQI